jgi:hypothetical protein
MTTTVMMMMMIIIIIIINFCFAVEDSERNDGSAEKPYFMSRNLMNILSKKNK